MRPRICVFGSANMDLVVYARRAPAMGETVTGQRFVTVPGGKGANQAIAAGRAGGAVTMAGAVGADPYGTQILEVLQASEVDVGAVDVVEETTGTAHIVVEDTGDNSIVVVPGANGTVVSPSARHGVAIGSADLVLLQLELPLEAVLAGARLARRNGARVVLTPAPVVPLPEELYAAVDLLVPNEHEARRLTGCSDLESAGRALLERVPEVVVTLGAAGARWFRRTGEPVTVPAAPVEARDTTAAGDAFVGALAVALGEKRDMEPAMGWATAAAALSVQRDGASSSMPARHDIDRQANLG